MSVETGHSVLVLPVPALEPYIRRRWEFYEPTWVSRDPAFTHAHITALAPFLRRPTAQDLARVGAIAAEMEPFDFALTDVATFPDGIIHLRPDPPEPFAALTARLSEEFPECPPYEGRFARVVPHLTLDQAGPGTTVETVRAALGDLVPVTTRADVLELHWYDAGDCHVMETWKLGADRLSAGTSGRPRS